MPILHAQQHQRQRQLSNVLPETLLYVVCKGCIAHCCIAHIVTPHCASAPLSLTQRVDSVLLQCWSDMFWLPCRPRPSFVLGRREHSVWQSATRL